MGKKSRKKKEKRLNSIEPSKLIVPTFNSTRMTPDIDFSNRISKLKELFSKYNAEDICISLNASDLWLPNISSLVKHHFAFGVLLSMSPDEFKQELQLDTFKLFNDFLKQVYLILPSFYMLEDYFPESDWGEVKILSRGEYFKIFYGCSIESIYDYVEAFKLKYVAAEKNTSTAKHTPEEDLRTALSLQDQLITLINRPIVEVKNISPGHVEIPSSEFWESSRAAILEIVATFNNDKCSPGIVINLGQHQMPVSGSQFSDDLFNGASMPGILAKIGSKYFPISPRSSLGTVLDYWENLNEKNQPISNNVLVNNIGKFLNDRFLNRELIVGPCKIATKRKVYNNIFPALILADTKIYFLVILNENDIELLSKIEKELYEVVSGSDDWVLIHRNHSDAIKLDVSKDDIEIIAIIPKVSAQFSFIDHPEGTKARICILPDFLTIMDSLNHAKELESFWVFFDGSDNLGPMSGVTDIFASFRDSHSVLVDGAITPNMIVLDPHWGSNWRYSELADFWGLAPRLFPDDTNIAWKIEPKLGGIQQLIAKGYPVLAQHVQVENCTVFFSFEVDVEALDVANGRILELFVHCIADSLAQRKTHISSISLFKLDRISIKCYANQSLLTSESNEDIDNKASMPLFDSWRILANDNNFLEVSVDVNLSAVRAKLTNATDATFEVDCIIEWLKDICKLTNLDFDSNVINKIFDTKLLQPRFTLSLEKRMTDVPDFSHPEVPAPVNYKLARKDMAILFQKIGAKPGRYHLEDAKHLIDQVRDEARLLIQSRIAGFERESLVTFSIKQYDELIAQYSRESTIIKMSRSHQVDYDRSERLAELHENYIRNAKNYRYLLECCLSINESGFEAVTNKIVVALIAQIDWLFVLYGASDVLYNGIDVAGVDLDQSFVPEIFYSENKNEQEKIYGLELANLRLGQGVNSDDEVNFTESEKLDWEKLDQAFLKDVGFTFKHFSETLVVLSQWQTVRGETDFHFSYQASRKEIIDIVLESFPEIPQTQLEKIIDFSTLEPSQIRRLLGREIDESDVPVWEYNKRGSRYTIRPLIPMSDLLKWGAGAVQKTYENWYSSISNGYLPADFPWPNVKKIVRNIKESIEKKLEVKAHEVCLKETTFAISGIDFKFRFPAEKFDDVGDYDVLAYWPESNIWVTIECKYNQPPYCFKDGRRLRERIFGIGDDHGQFSKIEGRREFLTTNLDKLRDLLKWPTLSKSPQPTIHELYVCREIYWWMRNPPYDVPTKFVRVDALGNWLIKLLETSDT